jgi:alpha/beta hydrolase family protein
VTKDTPMPPNQYPSIADGTLVKPSSAAMGFPKIPGKSQPDNLITPLIDYDLGPQFNYRDQSGIASQIPKVKQVLPQLVPRVDADGNEVAGIKAPLQMAPLGSYLGWNVISAGVFKGQLCNNNGTTVAGYIPFAKTKAERIASGDPRLSLEERYHTHEGYVKAVRDAANKLVAQRYLLQSDADTMIAQAEKSDVLADRN